MSSARLTQRGILSGYTLGTGASAVNLDWTHDEATDRLTESTMVKTGQPITSDLHYSYDPEGNLTKAADTPQTGAADTQCYGYDYLRRLTQAWTPSSADCTAAPSAPALGGTAPYWNQYGYDGTGNRTTFTSHDPAGGVDTVRTSTYPTPGPTTVRPHALTQVATSGPAGSATDSYGYDAAGNTTTRPGPTGTQTIGYDPEGLATSITVAGQHVASTVYDADGTRLVTHDSSGATLYLPGGMELHADPGGAPTATRYYSLGGVTVGMRKTSGLTWLGTDPHGTATVSMTPTGAATIRRQDPFGNPRGTQPQWSNNRGFLGGVMDPSGLTHLGARDYDPTLGRFTTPDPIVDPADPQQLNAYAYADNNPTTFSDPTGLLCSNGPDGMCRRANGKLTTSGLEKKQDALGLPDPDQAQTPEQVGTHIRAANAQGHAREQHENLITVVRQITSIVADALGITAGLDCILQGDIGGCLQTAGALLMSAVGGLAGRFFAKYAAPWKWKAGARLVDRLWNLARDGIRALRDISKADREAGEATRAAEAADKDAARLSCAGQSFTPDTPVLMADGTTRRIDHIKVGDKVKTSDPGTGKASTQTVTNVWVNHDADLMDLVIQSAGARSLVHTTAHHPIWDATAHAWTEAQDLHPGDHLATGTLATATVVAATPVPGAAPMWDLTITATHDFYIATPTTTLLVHNCAARRGDTNDEASPDRSAPSAADARFARKFSLSPDNPLVENRDMTVSEFVSTYRRAGIRGRIPGEFFEMTIGDALGSGNSTIRKLLTDGRWTK